LSPKQTEDKIGGIRSPQSLPPSVGVSMKHNGNGRDSIREVVLEEHKVKRGSQYYMKTSGNQEDDETFNNAITEKDDFSISESRDLKSNQVKK
jgi:hypothetical protein